MGGGSHNWKAPFNYNLFNLNNEIKYGASKFFTLPHLSLSLFSIHWKKKSLLANMQMRLQAITMLMRFPGKTSRLRPRAQAYFIHIQKTLCVCVLAFSLCDHACACVCMCRERACIRTLHHHPSWSHLLPFCKAVHGWCVAHPETAALATSTHLRVHNKPALHFRWLALRRFRVTAFPHSGRVTLVCGACRVATLSPRLARQGLICACWMTWVKTTAMWRS